MIRFTKMQGLGNDYIYVDAFAHRIEHPASLARRMADRHFGIGADGLILIGPPTPDVDADVRMRMFNADGSESEMCGNGVRCVCKYVHDYGLSTARPMRIETGAGVLSLDYELDQVGQVGQVTVNMGQPVLEASRIPIQFPRAHNGAVVDFPLWKFIPGGGSGSWMEDCGLDPRMTGVSMGNPHLIIYCAYVESVPLAELGPYLERQNIFPNRINVHFVQVNSRVDVTMRTWERGTGITLACGTGACAVCVAGVLTGRTMRDITAHLPGGSLRLHWDETTSHVFKTGPAVEVFTGEWDESATDRAGMPVATV